MAVSEMVLYNELFEYASYNFCDIDDYAWGEELIDYKIRVYKKSKRSIPYYAFIADNLINVGLITINKKTAGMIVVVYALYDTASKIIYVQENEINSKWKYLRKSVLVGMENNPETCESKNIKCPEDILELALLRNTKKIPYISQSGNIEYKGIGVSPEKMLLKAARQRDMDNSDMLYVYSANGGPVHDKLCDEVEKITDEDFRASAEIPDGRVCCSKCNNVRIIRKGCSPRTKQIPICSYIFRIHNVSMRLVEKMVDNGCKFYASDFSCLHIKGIEDNWEIRFDGEKNSLWHNNYIRVNEKERYITDGFHNQGLKTNNVNIMIEYIMKYTWERHLQAEKARLAVNTASVVNEDIPRDCLIRRIVNFFKNLWKRK